MGLKTAEKQIGSYTFIVTQLGALEGVRTLFKLKQAVGPAISAIARAVMAATETEKLTGKPSDKTEILNVVLATNIPDQDLEFLIKAFAASTKVQRPFTGDKTVTQKLTECLDDVLGGDYMTMLAWLVFAVEVNYADFFVGAIRTMAKDEPPAEKVV